MQTNASEVVVLFICLLVSFLLFFSLQNKSFMILYQQTRSLGYRITRHSSCWKKRRRDHVTPLLKELHWLPVNFRCQYKIAALAYRNFEGSLPPYLSSSLCTYEPSRSLRSSNEKLLKIPKRNLKSFGQRSFSFMAPSLWNSLPATLRNVPTLSQFKSQLKTFLFAQAFL